MVCLSSTADVRALRIELSSDGYCNEKVVCYEDALPELDDDVGEGLLNDIAG